MGYSVSIPALSQNLELRATFLPTLCVSFLFREKKIICIVELFGDQIGNHDYQRSKVTGIAKDVMLTRLCKVNYLEESVP